jgi:anthranilate synthase component II
MLLLIDNFDSFAHNLARYLQRLGQSVRVVRNDVVTPQHIERWRPQAIVLSPGPCTPAEAGCCLEIVRRYHDSIPMLGVCLGHQAIAAALGGTIVPAVVPLHGRTSRIEHPAERIFFGLPSPMEVCRYHSLIVDEASLPACLEVTARSEDGTIMAFQHRRHPVVGVQFHPESILTSHGYPLLAGFLREAGLEHRRPEGLWGAEYSAPHLGHEENVPRRPVTF